MTFFEKAKKFFDPVLFNPGAYIRSFTEGSSDGIFTVATLVLFEVIAHSLETGNEDSFYSAIIIYSGITFIYAILKFFVMRRWGWGELHKTLQEYGAEKYLKKYIIADPNKTESLGTGRLISIYEKGIQKWDDIFHHFTSSDVPMLIVTGYGIIRLFLIGPIYGIAIVGVIFLFGLAAYVIDKYYIIPSRKKRVEKEIEMTHLSVRIFMSKSEFLQGNLLSQEIGKLKKSANDFFILNGPLDTGIGGLFLLIRLLGFGFRLSIYLTVGLHILQSTQSFASFSLYIILVGYIENSLRGLYDTFRGFTRDIGKVEKLWSTFDSLTPIEGYSTGSTFTPEDAPIEIQNISYGYGGNPERENSEKESPLPPFQKGVQKVFENFSLTIEKGKKTALVGASGGGKTTLMKLIAGYLHPESGSISVMGNVLSKTALKTYYPHIGYLTQDPSVFDATIRENLVSAIGEKKTDTHTEDTMEINSNSSKAIVGTKIKIDTNVSVFVSSVSQDEMLEKALHLAHCDFVFDLEKGVDTEIGERGVRLSGGQKQRLAIAKIFLKNPEIILLDEPTSALDSFSEEKITEALDTLFQGRTVFIIAHRLQTVKKADDIIVIEGGSVVERGNHETLVKKKGIYKKMLDLQSGF